MCDCIKRLTEEVRVKHGAASAGFEHFGSQKSEVSYRPIRQSDGQPSKHNRYTSVNWNYCPFCGGGL